MKNKIFLLGVLSLLLLLVIVSAQNTQSQQTQNLNEMVQGSTGFGEGQMNSNNDKLTMTANANDAVLKYKDNTGSDIEITGINKGSVIEFQKEGQGSKITSADIGFGEVGEDARKSFNGLDFNVNDNSRVTSQDGKQFNVMLQDGSSIKGEDPKPTHNKEGNKLGTEVGYFPPEGGTVEFYNKEGTKNFELSRVKYSSEGESGYTNGLFSKGESNGGVGIYQTKKISAINGNLIKGDSDFFYDGNNHEIDKAYASMRLGSDFPTPSERVIISAGSEKERGPAIMVDYNKFTNPHDRDLSEIGTVEDNERKYLDITAAYGSRVTLKSRNYPHLTGQLPGGFDQTDEIIIEGENGLIEAGPFMYHLENTEQGSTLVKKASGYQFDTNDFELKVQKDGKSIFLDSGGNEMSYVLSHNSNRLLTEGVKNMKDFGVSGIDPDIDREVISTSRFMNSLKTIGGDVSVFLEAKSRFGTGQGYSDINPTQQEKQAYLNQRYGLMTRQPEILSSPMLMETFKDPQPQTESFFTKVVTSINGQSQVEQINKDQLREDLYKMPVLKNPSESWMKYPFSTILEIKDKELSKMLYPDSTASREEIINGFHNFFNNNRDNSDSISDLNEIINNYPQLRQYPELFPIDMRGILRINTILNK